MITKQIKRFKTLNLEAAIQYFTTKEATLATFTQLKVNVIINAINYLESQRLQMWNRLKCGFWCGFVTFGHIQILGLDAHNKLT